jgi:hypothetical protein
MPAKGPFYPWRAGNGEQGRSNVAGISKMLARGRQLTIKGTPKKPVGSVGARIVRLARKEIGVLEHPPGSNRGQRVEQYQASTTYPGTGWPYCAAFCRWVLDAAGVTWIDYRGASCPNLESWARSAGRWRSASTTPKPGWLVLFDWGGDGVSDHVGIVEVPRKSSVEANTTRGAGGNQSDGGGVHRRGMDHQGRVIRGYVDTTTKKVRR